MAYETQTMESLAPSSKTLMSVYWPSCCNKETQKYSGLNKTEVSLPPVAQSYSQVSKAACSTRSSETQILSISSSIILRMLPSLIWLKLVFH